MDEICYTKDTWQQTIFKKKSMDGLLSILPMQVRQSLKEYKDVFLVIFFLSQRRKCARGSRCAYSRAVGEGGGEGGGLFLSWIRPHVFLEIIILKNSV